MNNISRRQFLKAVGVGAAALSVGRLPALAAPAADTGLDRPNIILAMTDDQGWGDVSYNGLTKIKTPNLDAMAAAGVRFNRFYAAHPSCSPTRASVMTGRHPFRTGAIWPGMPLRTQEFTIAQAIKRVGYATGHFGKWHLSGGKSGKGRPLPADDPLHPGHFGFDTWFTVSNWFDTDWTFSRMGELVTAAGDGSDAIVAEALTFIKKNAESTTPFLAVIWFGSPHIPLKPTKKDLDAAGGDPYYGEMIGVDRSMGALRDGLRKLGIADNTMLWFNSDNGAWQVEKEGPDAYGSNGILRGHKGELWEGGIRVPGLIEWPARVRKPFVSDVPVVTSDIYPTIVDLLKIDTSDRTQPIDGISIMEIIDGKMKKRPKGIGFWHPEGDNILSNRVAWIDNQYKLNKLGEDKFELYDLNADPSEKTDIAAGHPDVVKRMRADMEAWQQSVKRSYNGKDYPEGKVIQPEAPKGK